jgi:hypothetical protein
MAILGCSWYVAVDRTVGNIQIVDMVSKHQKVSGGAWHSLTADEAIGWHGAINTGLRDGEELVGVVRDPRARSKKSR